MRGAILTGCLLLAACGAEPAADQTSLKLQPIGAPEMEQYDIGTGGCAFVPEGGGLGSLFVTDGDAAYMKVDGKVEKLAKAAGTEKRYRGEGYGALLGPDGLTIMDGAGSKIYDAKGLVRCAA